MRELKVQLTLIRQHVQRHKTSSPASITKATNQLKKRAEVIILSAELMRNWISSLKKANKAAPKRKQRKGKQI
jgi:hypothetical protein